MRVCQGLTDFIDCPSIALDTADRVAERVGQKLYSNNRLASRSASRSTSRSACRSADHSTDRVVDPAADRLADPVVKVGPQKHSRNNGRTSCTLCCGHQYTILPRGRGHVLYRTSVIEQSCHEHPVTPKRIKVNFAHGALQAVGGGSSRGTRGTADPATTPLSALPGLPR